MVSKQGHSSIGEFNLEQRKQQRSSKKKQYALSMCAELEVKK